MNRNEMSNQALLQLLDSTVCVSFWPKVWHMFQRMEKVFYFFYFFFNWQLSDLQSTSLGVLSKCVASGGGARENLHQGFSLRNIVSVLHEVRRPGATQSSICPCLIIQVFDWVVGVVVRLVIICGGHSLNFVRNAGYMKVVVERSAADVPRCVYCSSEKFRLESMEKVKSELVKSSNARHPFTLRSVMSVRSLSQYCPTSWASALVTWRIKQTSESVCLSSAPRPDIRENIVLFYGSRASSCLLLCYESH